MWRWSTYFYKNQKYKPLEIEIIFFFSYSISEICNFSSERFFQKMLNVSLKDSFKFNRYVRLIEVYRSYLNDKPRNNQKCMTRHTLIDLNTDH